MNAFPGTVAAWRRLKAAWRGYREAIRESRALKQRTAHIFTSARELTGEEAAEVSKHIDAAFGRIDEAFAEVDKAFKSVRHW